MEILCTATYPTTESQVCTVTFIGSTVQTVFPSSLALVNTVAFICSTVRTFPSSSVFVAKFGI